MQPLVVSVLSVFAKLSISPNAGGLPGTSQVERVISGLMFLGAFGLRGRGDHRRGGVGAVLARGQPPLRPARLRRALSVVATQQLARRLMTGYRRASGRLAHSPLVRSVRSGTPAVAIGVPVAYRIVRSTADRPTAQFWTVAVLADLRAAGRTPPGGGAPRRSGSRSGPRALDSRRPRRTVSFMKPGRGRMAREKSMGRYAEKSRGR
jgi:hypothetical protein